MNNQKNEDHTTLELLQVIEDKNDVTQRHIAERLDVALGLANSYLKRCVNKGLIKVKQAPANRYLYYLTPKGFTEKSRLTAAYLSHSFNFYREAGDSLSFIYSQCKQKNYKKIIFGGISELAEIASIRIIEHGIEVVGVWDPETKNNDFLHFSVWKNFDDIPNFDVCILTALNKSGCYYNLFNKSIPNKKIIVPSILDIGNGEN